MPLTASLRSRSWVRIAGAGLGLLVLLWTVASLRGDKVPAAKVERKTIVETLVVNGRVLARSKAEVGAEIAGAVAAVHVREGDRVRRGDVLVSLLGTAEQAEQQRAQSALREAEARLATLSGATAQANRQSLEQARLEQTEAERELRRTESLAAQGLVPQSDLDSARRRAGVARSATTSAAATDRSTGARGSERAATLASVAQARADVAAAEAQLAKTRIKAPADGTVLTRNVEPGVAVAPGTTVVVMTLDSETLLLAQPDEKSLGSLGEGMRARASADAFPDRHFDATIDRIAPNVDLQRGTVDVWLRVPDPPPYLKTDMTLSVEIESARKESALVIPADAVRDAARPWVLVIEKSRSARRDVKLGLRGDDRVEVLSGLSEGEAVLRGSASPGDRVRPDFTELP